jgi:hypothetical protein
MKNESESPASDEGLWRGVGLSKLRMVKVSEVLAVDVSALCVPSRL